MASRITSDIEAVSKSQRESYEVGVARLPVANLAPSSPAAEAQLPPTRIASANAMGLFAYGTSNLILALYLTNARGISHPNVAVGMAVFAGGLAQLLAGMWEFPRGNVFGATVFTIGSTFWLSYSMILIPASGVINSFGTNQAEYRSAVGIYLLIWGFVMVTFCLVGLGTTIGFIALCIIQASAFFTLAAGEFNNNEAVLRAGGIIDFLAALSGYYLAMADLLEYVPNPPFKLPVGKIEKKIAFTAPRREVPHYIIMPPNHPGLHSGKPIIVNASM